jgi:hypothetical protein
MKPARVRLVVCAALFVAWIGYLVYLAVTTTRPVILSRPQFLTADLYVIATVQGGGAGDAPAAAATIRQVVWSRYRDDLQEKDKIPLANLPESGPEQGWAGPGEYILPLTRTGAGKRPTYQVTPIPRSPGYLPPAANPRTFEVPARIYLATPVARRELADLKTEFHP